VGNNQVEIMKERPSHMQPWQHEFLCTMHTHVLMKAYHTTTRIT